MIFMVVAWLAEMKKKEPTSQVNEFDTQGRADFIKSHKAYLQNKNVAPDSKETKRALMLIEKMKERTGKTKIIDIIKILYPNTTDIRNYQNRFSRLKNGNINDANKISYDIENYLRDKEDRQRIYFDDIYNFLIDEKVCNRIKEEKAHKISGIYLLFRKSNIGNNKIIVSYVKVYFTRGTLLFISARNNLGKSKNEAVVCIETRGIVVSNTQNSIICLGISKNIKDTGTMGFLETLILYKNDNGSSNPIAGYWSGNILSKNSDPFVAKTILVKINSEKYIKRLEFYIKNPNKIHTIFTENELLNYNNIIHKILLNENNTNIKNGISGIINSLKIDVDENLGIFQLRKFS